MKKQNAQWQAAFYESHREARLARYRAWRKEHGSGRLRQGVMEYDHELHLVSMRDIPRDRAIVFIFGLASDEDIQAEYNRRGL